jgi:hypothetical protein
MRVLSSTGSVVIEIALGVLVVGIAAYAAYETHVAHTKPPVVNQRAATTQTPPTPAPKTAAMPTAPPPTVYRVPELGFEMTLPPGLSASDLYYVADTTQRRASTLSGSPYTVRAVADFSTHSLGAQEPTCAANLSNTGGRGLDGMSIVDIDPMSGAVDEPDLSVQLSASSWLELGAKQASCSREDLNATLESQQFHLLEQAFKTAQPL